MVKGLSREPMEGNPAPRAVRTASGMINSIGLQNIGVRAFAREKLPALAKLKTAVFANVFGYRTEDYVEVARVLDDYEGLAAYEINVSCPNTSHGGIYFSERPGAAGGSGHRREARGAAAGDRETFAQCRSHRASGAGRRSGGRGRNFTGEHVPGAGHRCAHAAPAIGAGLGGLSGPAIKPIALRLVWQAAHAVKIPVIGLGGIASGEDAAEFLIAGASAVQVGTATFCDPRSPLRIAEELGRFLQREKIGSVRELVGTLKL